METQPGWDDSNWRQRLTLLGLRASFRWSQSWFTAENAGPAAPLRAAWCFLSCQNWARGSRHTNTCDCSTALQKQGMIWISPKIRVKHHLLFVFQSKIFQVVVLFIYLFIYFSELVLSLGIGSSCRLRFLFQVGFGLSRSPFPFPLLVPENLSCKVLPVPQRKLSGPSTLRQAWLDWCCPFNSLLSLLQQLISHFWLSSHVIL